MFLAICKAQLRDVCLLFSGWSGLETLETIDVHRGCGVSAGSIAIGESCANIKASVLSSRFPNPLRCMSSRTSKEKTTTFDLRCNHLPHSCPSSSPSPCSRTYFGRPMIPLRTNRKYRFLRSDWRVGSATVPNDLTQYPLALIGSS